MPRFTRYDVLVRHALETREATVQKPLVVRGVKSQTSSHIAAVLAVCGALATKDVAGLDHGTEAPKKIEIVAIAVQAAITDFGWFENAVCIVGWDEREERYHARGESGKGQYLKAVTHGRFGGSKCEDFPGFRDKRQVLDREVMWLGLMLARGHRCAADYCVSVGVSSPGVRAAWDYRVKCPEAGCEVVGKQFVAEE